MAAQSLRLVSLEGNIGSGKSTLLKHLVKAIPSTEAIPEPIREWQQNNLLHLYYQDPPRWAFSFQTYALFSRLMNTRQAIKSNLNNGKILITQRSIEADRQIFADLLYKMGYMNEAENHIYQAYYDGFKEVLQLRPVDLFIYIRCSPEKCYERLKKRDRKEEQDMIPMDYLKSVHDQHENWLSNNPKAVIINTQQEFESDLTKLQSITDQVKRVLTTCK